MSTRQSRMSCQRILAELDDIHQKLDTLSSSLMTNTTRHREGLLPIIPPSPPPPRNFRSRPRPRYHIYNNERHPRLHIRVQNIRRSVEFDEFFEVSPSSSYFDESEDYESDDYDSENDVKRERILPEDVQIALLSLERMAIPTDISKSSSCPICLGEIVCGAPITSLPCQHTFHPTCLYSWFNFCRSKLTCPCCRFHVTNAIRQPPVNYIVSE